jgi:hypothetical protein
MCTRILVYFTHLNTTADGSAFSLGRINDKDTCYLYTLDSENSVPVADQTLEILMSELDPVAMESFYKSERITDVAIASKVQCPVA